LRHRRSSRRLGQAALLDQTGVQVNYSNGHFSASVSLNDGFYSEKYNWVSGMVFYAATPSSTITLVAAGNLSDTDKTGAATPLCRNLSVPLGTCIIGEYDNGVGTMRSFRPIVTGLKQSCGIAKARKKEGAGAVARVGNPAIRQATPSEECRPSAQTDGIPP